MANKIWNVALDGEEHTVEADYSMLSGGRWIEVDGERIIEEQGGLADPAKLFEMGSSSYQVTIGTHRGVVTFNLLRAGFDIDITLAVDGRPIA